MRVGINKLGLLLVVILLVNGSCSKDKRLNPDISKETLEIKIKRFDKDFYQMDARRVEDIQKMESTYPYFFEVYNNDIMEFGSPEDTSYYLHEWSTFMTDTVYAKVYQETLDQYQSLAPEEKQLTLAFRRYHALFPQSNVPEFNAYVSGFNNPIFYSQTSLSVSLENYLGADHPFYELMGEYKYKKIRKNRNRIVPDLMLGYLMMNFPLSPSKNKLLDQMIYEGKLQYMMKLMAPEIPDEVRYAFTPEQLAWCKLNAETMWIFLAENKHLYSSDRLVTSKYLNEAPNTSWFPTESPNRAVVWLGEQMVSQFMNNNSEVSVPDLMRLDDSQDFLKRSKFKP